MSAKHRNSAYHKRQANERAEMRLQGSGLTADSAAALSKGNAAPSFIGAILQSQEVSNEHLKNQVQKGEHEAALFQQKMDQDIQTNYDEIYQNIRGLNPESKTYADDVAGFHPAVRQSNHFRAMFDVLDKKNENYENIRATRNTRKSGQWDDLNKRAAKAGLSPDQMTHLQQLQFGGEDASVGLEAVKNDLAIGETRVAQMELEDSLHKLQDDNFNIVDAKQIKLKSAADKAQKRMDSAHSAVNAEKQKDRDGKTSNIPKADTEWDASVIDRNTTRAALNKFTPTHDNALKGYEAAVESKKKALTRKSSNIISGLIKGMSDSFRSEGSDKQALALDSESAFARLAELNGTNAVEVKSPIVTDLVQDDLDADGRAYFLANPNQRVRYEDGAYQVNPKPFKGMSPEKTAATINSDVSEKVAQTYINENLEGFKGMLEDDLYNISPEAASLVAKAYSGKLEFSDIDDLPSSEQAFLGMVFKGGTADWVGKIKYDEIYTKEAAIQMNSDIDSFFKKTKDTPAAEIDPNSPFEKVKQEKEREDAAAKALQDIPST